MKMERVGCRFIHVSALSLLTCVLLKAQTDRYWSGGGTWDTSTVGWAEFSGGPANTVWGNGDRAYLEGTAGIVNLPGAIAVKDLVIDTSDEYSIVGGTLNFVSGGILRTMDNRYWQTITSTITGSPTVETTDFGSSGQYQGFIFAPDGGTQTLGKILNPNNTGNTDKAGITFAGLTTGNTVESINYVGGDRYGDVIFASGGWRIQGDLRTGTIKFHGGTHLLNGTVDCEYRGFQFRGGTLGGRGLIREDVNVPAGGKIAPGDGLGILSFEGELDLTALGSGSGLLQYELGSLSGPRDRIEVTGVIEVGEGVLGASDFDFSNVGGIESGRYVLLVASEGIVGSLDSADLVAEVGGFTGYLKIVGKTIEWSTDGDLDGMPDAFELANTTPPSATSLNPEDDLENSGAGDGLTNVEEYLYGTDPNNSDSDGDTLEDGAEVAGVGSRPATDPSKADTDGDTLSDLIETGTGRWVSDVDTGSDPTKADTDADALNDQVETNTGRYLSLSDTGTNPNLSDTDGDSAGDWYEIVASETDPNQVTDQPNVPYPLPASDGSRGASDRPVQVYIMSGQSNMVGIGYVNGELPGSLETIVKREGKFPNLVDSANQWLVRNDVMYRGVVTAIGNGPLTAGQGGNATRLGPELGFGHIMGWYHEEPVLLLKSSQGNRSLSWDFLPPGSSRFRNDPDDGFTYAGYGESPPRWETGTTPTAAAWCAGLQYDQCFLDEADMTSLALANGAAGTNVVDILDNFASEYPEYATQGFEIAGFVWWQGHKDGGEQGSGVAGLAAKRYEQNLGRLIDSLREYYGDRYPGRGAEDAPFVVATIGFGGGGWDAGSSGDTIWKAQMAVSDSARYPQYAGNVASVDTTAYWRSISDSPGSQGFHYNNNAETYMLVGDALGRAMVGLLDEVTGRSGYSSWASINAPNGSPGEDFDGDGVANGLEYVLGGLAITDDLHKIPLAEMVEGQNVYRFQRAHSSIDGATQLRIEVSNDLVSWTEVYNVGVDTASSDAGIEVFKNSPADGTDTIRFSIPNGLGKRFVRVRVSVLE